MIDATHITIADLAAARAPAQRAQSSALDSLVGFGRIALGASILPITVFIGWLAATEPAIMIGAGLALALWIGCDQQPTEGTRAAKPEPRRPSVRALRERPTASDLSATASWS